MNSTNVADCLEVWVTRKPAAEVVRFGLRTWNWSEFADRVRRNAGGLRAAGVAPGRHSAVLDKNHPVSLETLFAGALTGTVHTPLNFRLSAEEYVYLLNDSETRLLFVGAEFAPMIESIRDRCPLLTTVIVVGGADDEYEEWLAGQEPFAGMHTGESCFMQLYTSGTTGFPKGAMLTHASMTAAGGNLAGELKMDESTVLQVAMPMFHLMPTFALMTLWAGGRVVFHREIVPSVLLEDLASGVTHAFLVPALLAEFVAMPAAQTLDFSRLRVLGYGAAPIPAPVLRRCVQTFSAGLLQVYGMTETTGTLAVLTAAAHLDSANPHRLVSVGQALPNTEIRVVDPSTGEDLPRGEVGEIVARTPQTMQGYWKMPEATAEAIQPDGWFRTGDAGRLDADGFLFLTDRIKDVIISGGENIYPAEIERVLVEHPSVGEVSVIGIPHERWGETPKAFVVAAPGHIVDADELITYCRTRLAGYKCPAAVAAIGALPRNPTGKVLKRELRRLVESSGADPDGVR